MDKRRKKYVTPQAALLLAGVPSLLAASSYDDTLEWTDDAASIDYDVL